MANFVKTDNVTKTSTTILFGFDQLSLLKTAGVSYTTTVTVTFA